jgi:hypothetical protein
MKQWVIAGALTASLGVAGAAQQPAQQQPAERPSGQQPSTTPPTATGTSSGQQPAAERPARRTSARRGTASDQSGTAGHAAPKQQPNTAPDPAAPTSAMALGRVHIPGGVKADGKPLPAGTYDVRLTADEAKPNAVGTSEKLERWVEFVQRGAVKGREVVSIVPETEIKLVQKDAAPRPGASKVERLKGGDYVRVWINKGGNHYLIHLPTGATALP